MLASTKQIEMIAKESWYVALADNFKKHTVLYLMAFPVVLYYIVFQYGPMFGLVIAFKDYRPGLGFLNSKWVGFENFTDFFNSYYFWSLLKTTLKVSFSSLAFGFPAPILLALVLNEVKAKHFKKVVQTITYMPHFISAVVMCGIVVDMVSTKGVINNLFVMMGFPRRDLLSIGPMFIPIYVLSDIWQHIGWGTIIYLAALAGISQDLYEAAEIDGAGRLRKIINVTLPGIAPTISVLFVMRVGQIMVVGWEKIILLTNPAITEYSEVISSFVYTYGIVNAEYSYATAVGLFNSVINLILLIIANKVSQKLGDSALW